MGGVGLLGEEADPAQGQQAERVEVVVAPAESPVQAGGGAAAGVTGQQDADRVAGADDLSYLDGGQDRFVGGAQATVVADAQHSGAGHLAREQHRARPGGQDHLARRAGEIHAAMPGQPRLRRRIERPHHRRRPRQRPAEAGRGHRPPDQPHPVPVRRRRPGRLLATRTVG
jgi:hypothetical protein